MKIYFLAIPAALLSSAASATVVTVTFKLAGFWWGISMGVAIIITCLLLLLHFFRSY